MYIFYLDKKNTGNGRSSEYEFLDFSNFMAIFIFTSIFEFCRVSDFHPGHTVEHRNLNLAYMFIEFVSKNLYSETMMKVYLCGRPNTDYLLFTREIKVFGYVVIYIK